MPLLANGVLHRAALTLACLAVLAPVALHAQEAVGPGARVRILAPSAADTLITGTVVAIDSATLLLAAKFDTVGLHVPLSAIRRLEVAADRGRPGGTAGLVGLLLGGVAGYVLFSRCGYVDECTDTRAVATAGGAVAGMLLGNLIFRDAGRDRWRTVPVPGHGWP